VGGVGGYDRELQLLMEARTTTIASMCSSNLSEHANSYLQVHVLSKGVDIQCGNRHPELPGK
jgi:hypothetical protein